MDAARARSLSSALPRFHLQLRLPRGTGYAVGLAVAMRLALSFVAA